MHSLLAAMGNPQQQLSVVHIAGTKGKGSVAALMSGVLRAAGYRVGSYTSPHMFDVRERIVVGGLGVPELTPSHTAAAAAGGSHRGGTSAAAAAVPAAVPVSVEQFEALAMRAAEAVASMSQCDPQQQQQQQQGLTAPASNSSSSSRPSHFEVVTAMALQHFVNESVDIAVIETGLGGATDATNVFTPQQLQLAVLTAVGMDHVDALGGSLESIATAKAGIMKAGVPVVVGPQEGPSSSSSSSSGSREAVLRVFRAVAGAADMQCPLVMAEETVKVGMATTSTHVGKLINKQRTC
jgi:folylpolyglutamate synthase/dihydropteroate synthase